MARTTRTRQLSLRRDADRILRSVGNASDYVSGVVEDRDREWRAAVDVLRAAGWSWAEIRSAADGAGKRRSNPIVTRAAETLAREHRAGNESLDAAIRRR